MPGSERLDAVIPDVTRQHWAVNIRKYVVGAGHLRDVVALGSLPRGPADFLDAAVRAGLSILVSGATQAGNPTSCQYTRIHGRDVGRQRHKSPMHPHGAQVHQRGRTGRVRCGCSMLV